MKTAELRARTAGGGADVIIDGAVAAVVLDGNPLSGGWQPPAPDATPPWLVIPSGTLAADDDAPEPRNWMPAGRAALDARWAALAPAFAGRRISIMPHRRHVLSDVPSCLTFLRDHDGDDFRVDLALAPAALLEPSMAGERDDHLDRIFEALGPRTGLVVLSSHAAAGGAGHGEVSVPDDVVLRLVERWLPAGVPVAAAAARPEGHATR